MALLGEAHSIATAPRGSLPVGVLPISNSTVGQRAGELSESAFRLELSLREGAGGAAEPLPEGLLPTLQDLFFFEKCGISAEGRVRGRFAATGIRPRFSEKLLAAGIRLCRRIDECSSALRPTFPTRTGRGLGYGWSGREPTERRPKRIN